MTNANPKVLVGCPVSDYHEYCTDEFIESIKTLSYDNYDILLVDNSKDGKFFNSIKGKIPVTKGRYFAKVHDRLVYNRNLLRQKVLDGGYDYFLNIDQDVIPPRDVIEKLLGRNKIIITGIYFNVWERAGEKRLLPLAWVSPPNQSGKMVQIKQDIISGNHLVKITFCGSGCLLIHRTVLEKIKFRYNLEEGPGVDDLFFCADAGKAGFEIYADTAVKCKHLLSGKTWCWDDMLAGSV